MNPIPHIPHGEPVAQMLKHAFRDAVVFKWSDRTFSGRTNSPDTGEARVVEALGALDAALTKLGDRKGERADNVRTYLTEQRTQLGAALEAWRTVGENCDGPAFAAVVERLEAAVSRQAVAEHDYRACDDINQVVRCRDASDAARVERNAALKAKDALLRACRLPAIPRLEAFSTAEQQTRELGGGGPMTSMHRALDQAREASPDVARLWICYEGSASRLFDTRWSRYLEARGADAPVAVAAE